MSKVGNLYDFAYKVGIISRLLIGNGIYQDYLALMSSFAIASIRLLSSLTLLLVSFCSKVIFHITTFYTIFVSKRK